MLIDPIERTIRIRQSWFDTATTCAERGRLDSFEPIRIEGDAAMAGTGMHAAVQAFLDGLIDMAEMEQFAGAYVRKAAAEGVEGDDGVFTPITYQKFDGPEELAYHAMNCTRGWIQDIYPILSQRGELVGDSEVRFEFEAFTYRDWTIIFQGTVDWVPHFGNSLWDWKSSASDYKQKDKQRNAPQPTVYAAAAVNGCFGREFTLPLDFHYGIAMRLKTKARGQHITVRRDQSHIDWLYRRTRSLVDLFLDVGPDRSWPVDEEHFLCSKKWCPWYSQCRGSYISVDDDLFGWAG